MKKYIYAFVVIILIGCIGFYIRQNSVWKKYGPDAYGVSFEHPANWIQEIHGANWVLTPPNSSKSLVISQADPEPNEVVVERNGKKFVIDDQIQSDISRKIIESLSYYPK